MSDIDINFEVKRFDNDLFELDTLNIENGITDLKIKYDEFLDIFTYKMISIGGTDDPGFYSLVKAFIADTMITNVRKFVDKEFENFGKTEKQLEDGFRHYNYYFPKKNIPTIYTCISGFNQSIVVAPGLIGISLENYLGTDCQYYTMLGLPQYKIQKMYSERLVADVMYGWASTEFLMKAKEKHLLSHMIHEGKLLYFLDAMIPDAPDTIKIGFTKKQLDWCNQNEAQMWSHLIINQKLYITGRMDIKRFIGDAPYTNGFPLESPGRAVVWIGWQIVRQYMDKHPEVTLPDLMQIDNAQELLNASAYFPE